MKNPANQQMIQYQNTTISYTLVYARRKTLGIHVYRDGSVTVKAPLHAEFAAIEAILQKRVNWILRQQHKFQTNPRAASVPRKFVNGEMYQYLGKAYTLQIETAATESIELTENRLIVRVRVGTDAARIGRRVTQWYRQQAEALFAERLAVCFTLIQTWGVAYPPLGIRTMKSRWGSCRSDGRITLNLRLLQVDVELIDYVMLHELCHLRELNHSKRFYALMSSVMPDWRARRERLNKVEIVVF